MRVIDERGRILGRINLIDAAVAILVLLLIPLAYGAFVLFRMPAPKITSLVPAQVVEQQAASVEVNGEDLRPFLLAKLGTVAADFFVQSPTRAEIKVPASLPAGTYDLTLADHGQVLTVKPAALVVAPPAVRLDVQAVGAFVGLEKEETGLIGPRSIFQAAGAPVPIAEVVALKAPEPGTSRVKIGANVFATGTLPEMRVPAIVKLRCAVLNGECRVAGTVAAPNATIALPWPVAPAGTHAAPPKAAQARFVIDQVFPPGIEAAFPAVASLRVRFVALPTILAAIKPGDADLSGAVIDTDRAVLIDAGTDRQTVTSSVNSESLLRVTLNIQQPAVAFTAMVRVPMVFTPAGWSYKERPVKVGGSFTFESASGAMSGWVLEMTVPEQKSRGTP